MKVTVDEILSELGDSVYERHWELHSRIKQHGIAPPDGLVLVPIEPTAFMIKCGQLGVTTTCTIAIYKAMLSASNHIVDSNKMVGDE